VSFAAEPVLNGLKRFQRTTVDYVFERFYGPDPVDRFLVADEVGLGKTMVARGLIAKLIEHLLETTTRRIDVVYICSNQAIAQQNFSRLAVVGTHRQPVVDRITTLPLHVRDLNRRVRGLKRAINFVPITPTTSLDLRSNVGRKDERALLWWMLADDRLFGRRFMQRLGALRALQPPAEWGFERERKGIEASEIDPGLWRSFVRAVKQDARRLGDDGALARFERLVDALRNEKRIDSWANERTGTVGALRRLLADSCVHALEPDLVVLDEFQRFPQLMRPGHPAAELAERLFRYPDVKVLLLSATPYRMMTRARELGEDHHAEFMHTTGFLLDDPEELAVCRSSLERYRSGLREAAHDGGAAAASARDELETRLKRVMCRTERLAATPDRLGMLDPNPKEALRPQLERTDLDAYRELDGIARRLGARDVVEYWKSTPYPLNLMDDYQLAQEFEREARRGQLRGLSARLDAQRVRRYESIDAGNPRMRGLLAFLAERNAWSLLWLPPSLPYVELVGPFDRAGIVTKALAFSAWHVVPKALATLTSYEAERRVIRAQLGTEAAGGREALRPPLRWQSDGSLTELVPMLPSRALARLADPWGMCREAGEPHSPLPRSTALQIARQRIGPAMRPLLSGAPKKGPFDYAWYALGPLLLDESEEPGSVMEWLNPWVLEATDEEERTGLPVWRRHVRRIHDVLENGADLGRPPRNLVAVMAEQALGGAGVLALRALERVVPQENPLERAQAALFVGDAFRRLFNLPEAVAIIRPPTRRRAKPPSPGGPNVYWRRALGYCLNGDLQAVLDEYSHVLRDWVEDRPIEEGGKTWAIADTMAACVGVHAADLEAREITARGRIRSRRLKLRTRFALRLDSRGEEQSAVRRVDAVRRAFNSPFWPFVLATTSVGQEGLDFHQYAHMVVHWNLPSNPVDLEQREGRVHRYKGHAIRRNLAARHRTDAFGADTIDPWQAMFDSATHADSDLQPYWVFHGPAKIERHVPAMPLSSETERLHELVRLLGVYRLAFGQPRQDELLAALASVEGVDWSELLLDLRPA
jgi:Helicase conserved C-terminal domain